MGMRGEGKHIREATAPFQKHTVHDGFCLQTYFSGIVATDDGLGWENDETKRDTGLTRGREDERDK